MYQLTTVVRLSRLDVPRVELRGREGRAKLVEACQLLRCPLRCPWWCTPCGVRCGQSGDGGVRGVMLLKVKVSGPTPLRLRPPSAAAYRARRRTR